MKKLQSLTMAVIILGMTTSCSDAQPAKEASATQAPGTNSRFTIAPDEYSQLSEKAFGHFARFDYDAWGDMLADDVVFTFPDGDVDTRTKLEGKKAVLDWWKNWHKTSGIQSMTLSEFNHFPLNVTAQPMGGALKGIYDFAYLSNKMVYNGKPVSLRMNMITHFNADKKIDRYITYYDRSVIIKATGKNILEK